MKKEKVCVYTCITGDYDDLHEIEEKEQGIDYYCFTNNYKITSKTWNVIYIEDEKLSNVQLARKTKILGHPIINEKYDILLWMDGAVVFKKKIKDFIAFYLTKKDTFVAFKHAERNSIKDECNACIKLKKETKENIKNILDFYKNENYPDDNGLIESTVYIKRPKDKLVQDTMDLWFSMILNYTKRDQLSFNYCVYKTGLKVKWINEKVFNNEWFDWENHSYEKEISDYRIYFGDEEYYNQDNDIQGKYVKENSTYKLDVVVPNGVNSIILEVSKVPCTVIKKIMINNKIISDIEYYNYINYKNKRLFYNQNAIVKINQQLKKKEKLNISINMEVLNDNEKNMLIDYLGETTVNQTGQIKILNECIKKLETEIASIRNSKGWKLLEKIRNIWPAK